MISASVQSDLESILSKKVDRFDFENEPAASAIAKACREVNIEPVLPPGLEGGVWLSLRKVTFETLIDNIVTQLDCAYEFSGRKLIVHRLIPDQILLAQPTYRFKFKPKIDTLKPDLYDEALYSLLNKSCEIFDTQPNVALRHGWYRAYVFSSYTRSASKVSRNERTSGYGFDFRFPEWHIERKIGPEEKFPVIAVLRFGGATKNREYRSGKLTPIGWWTTPQVELFVYEFERNQSSGRLKFVNAHSRNSVAAWKILKLGDWFTNAGLKSLSPKLISH
jgi:hypothetical protein